MKIKYFNYMIDELDGAENYYNCASKTELPQEKLAFKEMAIMELAHFDKLYKMGLSSLSEEEQKITTNNVFHDYFIDKYNKLKDKIRNI